MVRKSLDWEDGAELEDHTKKKHDVLKRYFRQYLIIRCQLPQQEKFRLAVIDGFSGAGLYRCGSFGSPLILVDTLVNTVKEINLARVDQGIRPIQVECLLLLNDIDSSVINKLKSNISPLLAAAKDENSDVLIKPEYFSSPFDQIYPQIKERLISAKCRNVFFNLDQYSYSHVTSAVIRDIITSWRSAEVLLTFMIDSMLAFLSPDNEKSGASVEPQMREKIDQLLDGGNNKLGKRQWLGEAEKVAYNYLRDCAPFVSPFSINNPKGWRYWLMHFASSYRARQVYNDILHQDGESQAHFGRSGLKMLSYDPKEDGMLYLFNNDSRELAKEALYDDIPRFVAESGDTLSVEDFYSAAYSETPAHSDDIHEMIIENPDLEVITESGGQRRQPNTIKPGDTLKLKSQKSMFFMFSDFPNRK